MKKQNSHRGFHRRNFFSSVEKGLSSIVFLSLLLGCSTSDLKESSAPQAPKEKAFQLRPIEEKTLANGLRVIYIQDQSLPRVSYQLFVQAGSAADPKGKEGLAALTSSMLEQGTSNRNATQTADAFAQLGSAFNESAAQDYSMMSTSGLSQFQTELLALFSDVILHPVFSPSELKRKKSQILAALTQKQDNPQSYADELLQNWIYAETSYGHPVSGQVSSVQSIRREDLLRHYRRHFRPNNALLAISGNFNPTLRSQVEKIFGAWKKQEIPPSPSTPSLKIAANELKLYSKSGLQQTQIRLGAMGIPRNHPDFLKLRIANVIFGGAFASRLNQRVRDDLGLTYSISSQFETHRETGSFEISTFSRNEKAGEAIRNTFLVLREFEEKGITEQELKSAKALLIGQFPAAIETVDRLAFNLLILRIYGISDSYLTDFFQNVSVITLNDVNQIIPKYFNSRKVKTMVFADETQVADQLKTLGPLVGSIGVEKVLPEKTGLK